MLFEGACVCVKQNGFYQVPFSKCEGYGTKLLARSDDTLMVVVFLQKSRDVGEFMRQLETSILVASNFLNSSWPTEKDVSILCQKPFLKMTLVADAVTQTSPRASRSSACYWECGCRPDEECIHHRELWWPSGSVDALDGSVNDKLSAADRTEASLDDILQASALEQCDVSVSAENSWRSSQSSSSRSLSESLDNLTPVGSASDEDDGSFASCSLTSSSSETLELPEGAALKESSPVWRQQESGRRQTFLGALLDKEPIVSDFGIERFDKETTKDSRRLNSTDRVRLSGSASTIPNSFTLTEDTKFRTVPVIKNRNPHETAIATVAEDSGKTQSEASPLSPSATHVWLLDINKSSSAPVLGERPTGSLEVIRRNRGSAAITNSQAKVCCTRYYRYLRALLCISV